MASNFDFLARYWPDMAQIGREAELCLYTDTNACIRKLCFLAEYAAMEICTTEHIELSAQATQADRTRALKQAKLLPKRIDDLFYILRKAGSNAVSTDPASTERTSSLLQSVFELCCWFMGEYGDPSFCAPAYTSPENLTEQEGMLAPADVQEASADMPMSVPAKAHTATPLLSRGDRAEDAKALPLTADTNATGNSSIRIHPAALPVINYAMQQNGAVAIQSITIENATNAPFEHVELHISASPDFALPYTQHIDYLPANKTITLSRPKLILNGDYLAGMTEKVTGVLHTRLDCQGELLALAHTETTVLAFDEWHGVGLYPELLAAFMTPNHPELAKVISRASEYMGQWTGDTSMDGYQSQDPNRVLSQAAAIFTAIKELGIVYINPPASFERMGQRIRLCDTVLQQKLGTCLDLTLLYASCLEAVGLYPLLITTEDHCFAGVWLEEKMFPESVQDDYSLITKRLASGINEIAVVEMTYVTSGKDHSFDDAKRQGEDNMIRLPVEYIIDVHRARMSRISPLPQRVHTSSGWVIEHDTSFQQENLTAPVQLDETIRVDTNTDEELIPKKVQWERKLLDLGMRNTLINLRPTKTQLPLLTGSLDQLENALADGSEYTVFPRPTDLHATELTFESLYEADMSGMIKAEFENKRLRSILTESELNKAIKELYRTAKAALEENGANTLYLALGMLRWFESKKSTKARYAPIILLPIEMVRKSAAQGYAIRLRDDEPQMNVTLLEKLKQDFGIVVNGVDPLPIDEHGIDIRRVLTILRQAVMNQSHWDILEAASIGIFSFSQFVMWNDIRNRTEDLLRNKVVRSLIDGKLSWDAQHLEIGNKVNENNVLLPLPADASQLYAIQMACSGESFVLHGPPGTGKSQTITSLIANALAQGQRVLFVAEKMAALEVVQKRLEAIGMGPFCLELHSNKSKKKDVLEQLRKATEVSKLQPPQAYAVQAEKIAAMRADLDTYVQKLHTTQKCGSTLYALINMYEQYKDAAEIAPFDRNFIGSLTKQAIEQQQLIVERMIAAAKELVHPSKHPLKQVGCTRYNQALRNQLQATVNAYASRLQTIGDYLQKSASFLGERQITCAEDLQTLFDIAGNLVCWYDMPTAWTKTTFPQLYFEDVIDLAQHSISANELEQRLLESFDPGFLSMDAHQLFIQFTEASSKWFLPKLLGTGKLCKAVNAYAKAPVNKDTLLPHIIALRDYQTESRAAAVLFEKYGQDLELLYNGKATDWNRIATLAATARENAQALYKLTGNYNILQEVGGKSAFKDIVLGLWKEGAPFHQAKTDFDTLLGITQKADSHWPEDQQKLCCTILKHADELKEWIAYVASAEEAKSIGLANVVESFEAEADIDILPAYKKALLEGLIVNAIDESGVLSQFSGAVFNEKIRQYKQMDKEWLRLSQQEIYCRLAGKIPNLTQEAAQSSELGILQRCIKSGGRGTSIRKLFEQIPNLLPRLCPCMLMSPISAAQYLDPKWEPFDIVVFDEASQLPTCKAVGVLARGRNAIIVGDPKQMPPTSFFSTNTTDEDNLEAEDLDSILDDCLALNMPQSHLLWHYRSRHESLIAFSNRQFYENKLLTFPSVNDRETKVRLIHVGGIFDRGKTRTNKAEAEAIVDEIKRRFSDPLLSKQSLGVVTFNIAQQHLIDDLINELCAQNAAFENWAYHTDEPLFIKNLENVQGDERDVILFSIGFGPDDTGKVYMNFGPLNRDGGWRRLNVAVSRARNEMTVFSTLHAEQLDLNRTKAEGVAALRRFLEYAEGRTLLSEEGVLPSAQEEKNGIASAICRFLKEKGFDTDLSVGKSQYRMDIGVIDPQKPGVYILGIMLDGSSYGYAKTTRDRELAQISVLNGLGWNILRIWCMDWWDNRQKELNRIMNTLQEIQTRAEFPTPMLKDIPPKDPTEETTYSKVPTAPVTIRSAPLYRVADLPSDFLSADMFTDPGYLRDIQSRLSLVIDAEAPVSQATLMRRVVQSYGIARAGSRIQNHIGTILQKMKLTSTTQEDMTFYWAKKQNPGTYVGYRVNGEGESRRDVRDVPIQEIASAIYAVLHEQFSMAQEDLLRETAKKLGYTRLGGNVLSQLALGIQYAVKQNGITPGTNGAYVLTTNGTQWAEAMLKGF